MHYQQATDFIHGIGLYGPKPGLKRITELLKRMGNPQDKLRFIHVAGTNGKGSTCTMLSYILRRAGYTVGLNISPYVLEFRERFQVNNQMIGYDELAEITTFVKHHWDSMDAEGHPPSEFEVVVAVAMEFFLRRNCDIVVLEVGMGGRFDATNVIQQSVVSVITSISRDHVASLGETIPEIAGEKAGIIKKNGITVTYPKQDPAALAVIMEHCAALHNTLVMPHQADIFASSLAGTNVAIDGLFFHIPLAGQHQVWNSATVVAVCRQLQQRGFAITDQDIIDGIQGTRFVSRLEILANKPITILDGAHNLSGAQALADMLDTLSAKHIHAVIGIMKDKAVDDFLSVIASRCHSIVATSIGSMPRFIAPEALAQKAKAFCNDVTVEPLPAKAYELAKEKCGPEDILLLCGSLYLASELRAYVVKQGETHDTATG